ncbi:hypothetical protein NPIL_384211 [Nephila pilipes]|uniref:Uncharacterized protein n=1 Tax=Nephila pilipes TaxID=299642 RepID=A0A8X6MIF2_NEPPI|nr:hypothetical protein NPIL_384211 [Nephila pilipes]
MSGRHVQTRWFPSTASFSGRWENGLPLGRQRKANRSRSRNPSLFEQRTSIDRVVGVRVRSKLSGAGVHFIGKNLLPDRMCGTHNLLILNQILPQFLEEENVSALVHDLIPVYAYCNSDDRNHLDAITE